MFLNWEPTLDGSKKQQQQHLAQVDPSSVNMSVMNVSCESRRRGSGCERQTKTNTFQHSNRNL